MDVQLPDGSTLAGIPDGTTKGQIAEKLKASGHAVPDDWLKPQGKQPGEGYTLGEHADIAAGLAGGAAMSMLGGVAKAGAYVAKATGADKLLGTDKIDPAREGDWFDKNAYQPRTKAGKAVLGDFAKGMQAYEDWTERQGQGATDAVLAAKRGGAEIAKALGAPQSVVDFIETHGEQLAAGTGAALKTGLNALPLVAGSALKLPKGAAGAGELAEAPKAAPPTAAPAAPVENLTLSPSAPRAAPGASPSPVAPPAAPLEVAPAVPRGTPSNIGEGPAPPPAAPPATPQARAQAYARDRLGVAWDDLAERTQRKLELVAKSARGLDGLNPEAVKRQAKLEGLRVPIKTTAGRLTRDDAQLIKEEGAAGTNAGRSIRETDIVANRDLRRNVEVLIDRLRGVGASRAGAVRGEKLGEVIAGRDAESPGILTKRERVSEANVNRLYKTARETNPDVTASSQSIQDLAKVNPAIQHLNWVPAWFKKAAAAEGVEAIEQVKLKDLQDLRTQAVGIAKAGGPDGFHAGQVIEAIDKTMEEAPETAAAWKTAQKAFREHKQEFTNRQAIARLVETKGGAYGSDPKTALEDVWKVSIKNARIEEVRQLKRSLLSGSDPATRLQGKQALRSLRAATAQNLLDEITKGVSTNEAGEANITADSINRWIKGIGQDSTVEGGVEKLEAVFGRKATRELMDIREAAQITKTAPTTRVSGSNTFQNILNWMEDTGLGGLVKNVGGGPLVHLAESAYKAAEKPAIVRSAHETATSAAERPGKKAADKRLDEELRTRRTVPTYGQQE